MKKEFIPFAISLGISFLNLPIILLFDYYNAKLIETVLVAIIIPIEAIMIGLSIIYAELKSRINERKNYKMCFGVIKKTKFKFFLSNWIKAPVVTYTVNGKNYETTANFGINGIFSFFLKGKKVKVYYKEDNPQKTLINNNVPIIVGCMCISIAIIIIFFI